MHEEEERLIEKQSLLNQREQYILERLENLSQFEKKLEEEKSIFEGERKALTDERSKLDLNIAALAIREEVCIYCFFSSNIFFYKHEHLKCTLY